MVSLSPAVTESLFEMGLEQAVVGVSAFDLHPEEARRKPVLGSYSTTNLDKLSKLNPELVFLTTGYQRGLALELSKFFRVYALPLPSTVASVINQCVEAGLVMGYPEKARELSRRLHLALCRGVRTETGRRVYVEIDLGGPVTFGANSYITDALSLAGGYNVFGDDPVEWETPSWDRLAKQDPDMIIYEPKMFRRESLDDVLVKMDRRGLSSLKAVRNRAVLVTPGPYDFLAHHGPSFITRSMPWLSDAVNGESGGSGAPKTL